MEEAQAGEENFKQTHHIWSYQITGPWRGVAQEGIDPAKRSRSLVEPPHGVLKALGERQVSSTAARSHSKPTIIDVIHRLRHLLPPDSPVNMGL